MAKTTLVLAGNSMVRWEKDEDGNKVRKLYAHGDKVSFPSEIAEQLLEHSVGTQHVWAKPDADADADASQTTTKVTTKS